MQGIKQQYQAANIDLLKTRKITYNFVAGTCHNLFI